MPVHTTAGLQQSRPVQRGSVPRPTKPQCCQAAGAGPARSVRQRDPAAQRRVRDLPVATVPKNGQWPINRAIFVRLSLVLPEPAAAGPLGSDFGANAPTPTSPNLLGAGGAAAGLCESTPALAPGCRHPVLAVQPPRRAMRDRWHRAANPARRCRPDSVVNKPASVAGWGRWALSAPTLGATDRASDRHPLLGLVPAALAPQPARGLVRPGPAPSPARPSDSRRHPCGHTWRQRLGAFVPLALHRSGHRP